MPCLRVRCKCDGHKWVGHPGYDENHGCGEQTPHTPNSAAPLDRRLSQVLSTDFQPIESDPSTMPGTFPDSNSRPSIGTYGPPFARRRRSSRSAHDRCPYCGCDGVGLHGIDSQEWIMRGILAVVMLMVLVLGLAVCSRSGINPWFGYIPVVVLGSFGLGLGDRLLYILGA